MKINNNKSNINFKGVLNNGILLKGLETVANHPATFATGTSLAMALTVRPIAIMSTPNVKKENKKYAAANSIASGLMKFAMVEAVALPIEKAICKTDKNPEKFLKPKTISVLKEKGKDLVSSKNYGILTQLIKLSANFIMSVPKSLLTVALIPVIADKIFKIKNNKNENRFSNLNTTVQSNVFSDMVPSFKGGRRFDASNLVSGIMNNKKVLNFVNTNDINSQNLARNMSIATDVLLTATSAIKTMKSKKIKEERKKPLIYNNVVSTGLSIVTGCFLDKIVQKGSKNFIEKFTEANKNNPKLSKYIQGINIMRPTLIFAGVYYGLLPMVSSTVAEKLDNIKTGKK